MLVVNTLVVYVGYNLSINQVRGEGELCYQL